MKKLSKLTALLLAILGINLLAIFPVHAANNTNNSYTICNEANIPESVKEASGCNNTADSLPGLIENILTAVISISGLVAVVFIIIGGVNYMTSSGDSAKVEKAKKTILYACIGLVICALAFAIVNWTIGAITTK